MPKRPKLARVPSHVPSHVTRRGVTWLDALPIGAVAALWNGRLVKLEKVSPGGAYVRYPDDGSKSIIARKTEVKWTGTA